MGSGRTAMTEFEQLGKAGFYPMAEAWKLFEPVGLPGTAEITFIDEKLAYTAYIAELRRMVNREIADKVEDLEDEIKRSGENPRLINKLGILYAKYGMYDEAEKQFTRIVTKREHAPALMNLGNIYYLRDDLSKALKYYDKVHRLDPYNPNVLVNLLRVHKDREDRAAAKKTYEQLAKVSPEKADEYRYLIEGGESTTRAGEAEAVQSMLWDE